MLVSSVWFRGIKGKMFSGQHFPLDENVCLDFLKGGYISLSSLKEQTSMPEKFLTLGTASCFEEKRNGKKQV